MNEDELQMISANIGATSDLSLAAGVVRGKFNIGTLFVTLGDKGAFLITDQGVTAQATTRQSQNVVVDSVGAGDAFSAACIYWIIHGRSPVEFLEDACGFATQSCLYRGATTASVEFYAKAKTRWFNHQPSTY